jgi:hypothetical protein
MHGMTERKLIETHRETSREELERLLDERTAELIRTAEKLETIEW